MSHGRDGSVTARHSGGGTVSMLSASGVPLPTTGAMAGWGYGGAIGTASDQLFDYHSQQPTAMRGYAPFVPRGAPDFASLDDEGVPPLESADTHTPAAAGASARATSEEEDDDAVILREARNGRCAAAGGSWVRIGPVPRGREIPAALEAIGADASGSATRACYVRGATAALPSTVYVHFAAAAHVDELLHNVRAAPAQYPALQRVPCAAVADADVPTDGAAGRNVHWIGIASIRRAWPSAAEAFAPTTLWQRIAALASKLRGKGKCKGKTLRTGSTVYGRSAVNVTATPHASNGLRLLILALAIIGLYGFISALLDAIAMVAPGRRSTVLVSPEEARRERAEANLDRVTRAQSERKRNSETLSKLAGERTKSSSSFLRDEGWFTEEYSQ
jgi:hypothetical protein